MVCFMVLYGFGNVRVNCNVFGGCRTIPEYYDDTVQIWGDCSDCQRDLLELLHIFRIGVACEI